MLTQQGKSFGFFLPVTVRVGPHGGVRITQHRAHVHEPHGSLGRNHVGRDLSGIKTEGTEIDGDHHIAGQGLHPRFNGQHRGISHLQQPQHRLRAEGPTQYGMSTSANHEHPCVHMTRIVHDFMEWITNPDAHGPWCG